MFVKFPWLPLHAADPYEVVSPLCVGSASSTTARVREWRARVILPVRHSTEFLRSWRFGVAFSRASFVIALCVICCCNCGRWVAENV